MAKPQNNRRNEEFDLGFEIFEMIREPGRRYTQAQIAAVVGCSRGLIYLIEKAALEKLRQASRNHELQERKAA